MLSDFWRIPVQALALDIPFDAEIMAGCGDCSLKMDITPDRGRILRATRCIAGGEQILRVPREHHVVIPKANSEDELLAQLTCGLNRPSGENMSDVSAMPTGVATPANAMSFLEFQMYLDFAKVEEICELSNAIFGADAYWAALMSLTPDQGPAEQGSTSGSRRWHSISAEVQARLLLLYRPESMSSTCGGRCTTEDSMKAQVKAPTAHDVLPSKLSSTEEELGPTKLPHRIARTVPTFDIAVQKICECFDLRIDPVFLEKLVCVWKYNSFCMTMPNSTRVLDIFLAASMLNHSCFPNCKVKWIDGDCLGIFAGSAELVLGEEATITYLCSHNNDHTHDHIQGADLVANCIEASKLGTLQNRETLSWHWLFFCKCADCALVKVPTCPQCVDVDMSIVVSRLEEEIYPGYDVICDHCGKEDLYYEHGYFFHCFSCDSDLCPNCGAM